MKKTSIWAQVKRFFSPMNENFMIYFIGILVYLAWWIDRVIHIVFLERIIYFLEEKNTASFSFILKLYLIYIFIYGLFTFLTRKKWWTEISSTVVKYVQKKYLKIFINLENNHIEKHWTGKLTAIINNWISRWGSLLENFFNQFIILLISFIFTSYMLFRSDKIFLFIFFFVYFIFYISSYFFNLWALKYRRKRRDNWNYHVKNLVKIIMNKQEILQSDKINHELKILDWYKDKEIFYNKKMSNYLYPLFQWPNLVISFLIVLLFWYLWNMYLDWEIKISMIVWLTSALILMQSALNIWIAFFKDFTKDFVDIEKLWDFFDNSPKYRNFNKWNIYKYNKWEIVLNNISYSYVKWKKVLDNFNLKIKWWSITALVWESGWWKSTIAKLIWWYITTKKWFILIDNQEINKLSMKSYYENIWYLTQEPSVFDWTVLENLTYAIDWKVDNKKIEKIIKISKCEFIYGLQKWINTEIWERWVKLSWWQRQRIAIAKIMLKDPKIIILDEPTSALDSFSEEQITKAMNNLFKNRTVIVIAHRLQTVKNADKIFVINEWKIIEKWTHKELIKEKWKYAKMLELQSWF